MRKRNTVGDNDHRSGLVDSDITQALTDHAYPLASVSPEYIGDDLSPIGDAAAEVDVFGMGETSHGTREFFQAKHRLFRYLVTEHDYRLLGIEADFAAVLPINDYVIGGDKSVMEGLTQQGIHAVYKTESMLELFEWIRDFNTGREEADKIRIHGFDIQDSTAAARTLRQYFQRVAPAVLTDVADEIDQISTTSAQIISDHEEKLATHLDSQEAVVERLGDAMESNQQAYRDRTAPEQYELARRLIWQLEQGHRQYEAVLEAAEDTENIRIRDGAMANQIQWLLEYESADQIAIWGHNSHLGRSGFLSPETPSEVREQVPSAGSFLASNDEVSYFALALSLGGGTVRSAYIPEREFRAYKMDDPPSDSLPGVFSDIDEPLFFLNTSQLPPESPLAEWCESKPVDYHISGMYEETPISQVGVNPKEEFDGIVFVRDTTASILFIDREWILTHPLAAVRYFFTIAVKQLRQKLGHPLSG